MHHSLSFFVIIISVFRRSLHNFFSRVEWDADLRITLCNKCWAKWAYRLDSWQFVWNGKSFLSWEFWIFITIENFFLWRIKETIFFMQNGLFWVIDSVIRLGVRVVSGLSIHQWTTTFINTQLYSIYYQIESQK